MENKAWRDIARANSFHHVAFKLVVVTHKGSVGIIQPVEVSLSNPQRGNLMEISVETSLLKTRFPTQLHVFLHLEQALSVWSDASSRVQ